MAPRRKGWLRAGLVLVLFVAGNVGPGRAAEVVVDPGGLGVAPATASPGEVVTWTILGPPGATAVLAWSRAGSGASFQGVPLAVGTDMQILAVAPITSQGRMDFSLRVPDTAPTGTVFFQAATIQGDRVRLTNGVNVTVQKRPAPRGGYY